MTDEQREINSRVALVLGWSGLEDAASFIAECWPEWKSDPDGIYTHDADSGWFGWEPGAVGPSSVGGIPHEGADKQIVPNFCTDPAAADLVRVGIEWRGWEWLLCRQNNEYQCVVRAWWDANRGIPLWEVAERSEVSPHMALCLAFLAACEAKTEGSAVSPK